MAKFTPQRARFPLHTDNFQFSPDVRVQPGVIEQARSEGRLPAEMEHHNIALAPKNGLYRKSHASYNDPIAVLYVVDAILKTPRGHYIRPRYLIPYLRQQHMQYFWSETSVGRIVAGIYGAIVFDVYEEHILNENMSSQADTEKAPFASGRDSKGRYYVVDPLGGNEGILYLTALRNAAYKRGQLLMLAEQNGDFESEYAGSAKVGWEAILEYAPTAIRGKTGYYAQTHPEDRFSYVTYDVGNEKPVFA